MQAFRIGRLFGVELRVDWSWLFVFVLLTWNLTAVFAGWHPDWPPPEAFAVALLAALLFSACILVHELAHAFVARGRGLRVRSITLFLFGGVSNIEHEPPSAAAEFLVAIVGPLTSLALGVVFVALSVATALVPLQQPVPIGVAQLGPVGTLLAWLGPINLVIGLFNLVPAFPLDGGRVLRAILWSTTGDLRSATRRVSVVGQVLGWTFIVVGIAMTFGARVTFFGSGLAGGLWLAFIGWFLRGAAAQAYRQLAIDDALAGHTVDEIMRRDGPTVPPELPLSALVHDYLVQSEEHALPVVSDGQLVGLVAIQDVRSVPPAQWPDTPVGSVMRSEELRVATPDEPLTEAFAELARQDIGQLPVLDHGRLVGVLRRRDVARWIELAWQPATTRAA